jgi:hypothetical protein
MRICICCQVEAAMPKKLLFTEIVSVLRGERKGYVLEDVRRPVKLINMVVKEMEGQTKAVSGSPVE